MDATISYSGRHRRNFANHPDFRADIGAASKPRADELVLAEQYPDAVRGAARPISFKLIEGVNHMGIVSDPAAVSIVAGYFYG
ncbi:MAG: hypothetical protein ACJ8EK_06795 [Bradyrhizobium sp.]